MNKRWVFMGVAVIAVLALTAGVAFAAGRGAGSGSSNPTTSWSQMVATCDAMHASPSMAQMRAYMPAVARAQCEAMHEQMGQMMNGSGMMNGTGTLPTSGMMGGWGSGMMGSRSHASHHPGASEGR
jgi:hypothetical protein